MLFFLSNFAIELMLSGSWWLASRSVRIVGRAIGHYVIAYVFRNPKEPDKTYVVYEERWNKLIEQTETQKKEIERLRFIVENWIEREEHQRDEVRQSRHDIQEELNKLSKKTTIS
jgi:beta-xylosidase